MDLGRASRKGCGNEDEEKERGMGEWKEWGTCCGGSKELVAYLGEQTCHGPLNSPLGDKQFVYFCLLKHKIGAFIPRAPVHFS